MIHMAGSQTGITKAKIVDFITGLPDRSSLADRLEQLLSQSQSGSCSFALLLVHITNLQSMVDAFSDLIVDEVLQTFSSRLRLSVVALPGTCFIARVGADKFAILLPEHAEKAVVAKFAVDVQKKIEHPFKWRSHEISMRISIGISLGAGSNTRPEDVLWDADTALSQAKRSGKGWYAIFEPGMRERAVASLALENEFRQAVGEHDFVLHYQPRVLLRSRELAGFEALIRWNHPKRGLVAPGEFIPVAEETGLILPLGKWVLEEACCQMSAWRREIPQAAALTMSVNLSSQQLLEENLVDHIKCCLHKHGLAAQALHLEITETSIVEDTDLVLSNMERLRALKIDFHSDDFGTGYSSLGNLRRFPFSTLKIDRSFVAHMEKKDTVAIIRAILSLSHALGISVVAEGIETPEQANQLEQLGCHYGQGYFFSRPVESSAATQMILMNKLPQVDDPTWISHKRSGILGRKPRAAQNSTIGFVNDGRA
jgi:diguanylate cyclase (GGDEF)-like protein